MRKHAESATAPAVSPVAQTPLATAQPQVEPPLPAPSAGRLPPGRSTVNIPIATAKPKVGWDRVTIRLITPELEKLNDLVIATQQATRMSKITATDILRVALRRMNGKATITPAELQALRADDGRLGKGSVLKS